MKDRYDPTKDEIALALYNYASLTKDPLFHPSVVSHADYIEITIDTIVGKISTIIFPTSAKALTRQISEAIMGIRHQAIKTLEQR